MVVRVRRLRGGACRPRQGAVPGRPRCRHRAYGIPHPLSLRAQADRPGPHRNRYAPLEPSTISPRSFVDVSGRARAIRGDSDRPHSPPVQRGQGKLRCRGVPRRTGEVRSRDRAARGGRRSTGAQRHATAGDWVPRSREGEQRLSDVCFGGASDAAHRHCRHPPRRHPTNDECRAGTGAKPDEVSAPTWRGTTSSQRTSCRRSRSSRSCRRRRRSRLSRRRQSGSSRSSSTNEAGSNRSSCGDRSVRSTMRSCGTIRGSGGTGPQRATASRSSSGR